MNSKDHTTIIAAVKAAGPMECWRVKLPPGSMNTLLKPENKPMLVKILAYHVVASRYTAAESDEAGEGGNAKLKTVEGIYPDTECERAEPLRHGREE